MNRHMTDLQGGTAVITRAASGFGRELALLFAAARMQLVLTAVDLPGLERTRAMTGLPPPARGTGTGRSQRGECRVHGAHAWRDEGQPPERRRCRAPNNPLGSSSRT